MSVLPARALRGASPSRARLPAAVAERAVAGLTPAVARYGPSVRRFAGDLTLLGPAAPVPPAS